MSDAVVSRGIRSCNGTKRRGPPPRIVAVISSTADLQRALRLRRPPDLFELRLDALIDALDEVQRAIPRLAAPVIITARHPIEGGMNKLRTKQRTQLLLRFLPFAAYVDIELRSIKNLRGVVAKCGHRNVCLIVSLHEIRTTSGSDRLQQLAVMAANHGADIFKVATRTDTAQQLARLLRFFDAGKLSIPIGAMGIGKLGRASRVALLRKGSALNYAHLGRAAVPGQLSLTELRRHIQRTHS